MTSHQRIIRDNKALEESAQNKYWENINTDIKNAVCKPISIKEAKAIILEYEYLGTMCNAPMFAYGIFYDNVLAGVDVFGAVSPPSVRKSISKIYEKNVIQLSRGACIHWAHPHSGSKLIAYSLGEVKKLGYKIVVAYADPRADEIGTLYQATNWLYCGMTAIRPDYCINGKVIRGPVGKITKDMSRVPRPRKHRYIHILGTSKKEKKEILSALLWQCEKEYPKREM